jgi:hypothetical protein
MFIEMNQWSWSKYPTVDQAEEVVLAVAAGEWDEQRMAASLREWLTPPRSTLASTQSPLE